MKEKRSDRAAPLSFDQLQRLLTIGALFLVTLWVRIDSIDSTIVKGPLLLLLSSLIASLFLARILTGRRFFWYPSAADKFVLVFLLFGVFSTIVSPYSSIGIQSFLLSFAYAGCLFVGTQYFRDARGLILLITSLTILCVIVCAFGLVQYFFGDDLGIVFQLGVERRVPSTLGNTNFLAGFVAMMIPIVLSQVLSEGSGRRRQLSAMALVVMMPVLMITQTRSSMVAACAGGILMVLLAVVFRSRPLWLAGLFALACAVVIAIVVPGARERLGTVFSIQESASFQRRLAFWQAGIGAVLDAPLLGHGVGSHEIIIPQYREPDYWVSGSEDIVPHAHNEFLEIVVELGIPGLILFMLLLGVIIRNGVSSVNESTGWKRTTAAGILCGIIAILIDNLANVSLRQPPVAMTAWLLSGTLLSGLFRNTRGIFLQLPFKIPKIVAVVPVAVWGLLVWSRAPAFLATFESDFHLLQARRAEAAGRRSLAIDEYSAAVSSNPKNLVARLDQSMALLRGSKPEQALATIRELRSIAPFYPKSSLVEAIALLELGKLTEGMSSIERELKLRDHPDAYYVQSVLFTRLQDTTNAWRSLEMVLKQDLLVNSQVQLDNACRSLLSLARTGKDYERLVELLSEIAVRFPQNQTVAQILGEAEKNAGD